MLGFRDDDYIRTIKEIRGAANNFREEERPSWKRVEPWNVCFLSDNRGYHKWCIHFFDADGHWHGVSFETPPDADNRWYREEIARQIRDN